MINEYSNYRPSFYSEIAGNDRKITAKLPLQLKERVTNLTDEQRTQSLPLLAGENFELEFMEFTYFVDDEKDAPFVRFKVHKFVSNKKIDGLIDIAITQLEKLK